MESHMLGINDAVIGECVWREAPVYVGSTWSTQFWDMATSRGEILECAPHTQVNVCPFTVRLMR